MKRITLLLALLVCSFGFAQQLATSPNIEVIQAQNRTSSAEITQQSATQVASDVTDQIQNRTSSAEITQQIELQVPIANERSVLALCANPLLEINQDFSNTCMALINQGGIAQSFQPVETESAGAGFKFETAPNAGLDLTLTLWDDLPPNGGVALASGTTVADGVAVWLDVFWDVTTVVPGNTYYIVVTGSADACISGALSDVYPGGNVYANAGYQSFPGFDYTFRTYSCDGGGGCAIVSDCNLMDSTPDDATSPDIWDRPFAGGTC
ncbi:MAG: hypothetical protein ACI86C_000096, partial [Candidatus Latescibacterota bacterium]